MMTVSDEVGAYLNMFNMIMIVVCVVFSFQQRQDKKVQKQIQELRERLDAMQGALRHYLEKEPHGSLLEGPQSA